MFLLPGSTGIEKERPPILQAVCPHVIVAQSAPPWYQGIALPACTSTIALPSGPPCGPTWRQGRLFSEGPAFSVYVSFYVSSLFSLVGFSIRKNRAGACPLVHLVQDPCQGSYRASQDGGISPEGRLPPRRYSPKPQNRESVPESIGAGSPKSLPEPYRAKDVSKKAYKLRNQSWRKKWFSPSEVTMYGLRIEPLPKRWADSRVDSILV